MENKCCGLVKFLVVLLNLLFWIVGILLVILAVWMLVDPTFLISMTQDENNYRYGLFILLAVGGLMVIVSFLGCCGAFRESQCMLVSFFCCFLLVLTAEIAAGVWAFHNSDKLEELTKATIRHTVKDEYGVITSRTFAFDTFQSVLSCCGAQGPNDWSGSKYNNFDRKNSGVIDLTISAMNSDFVVPKSCCNQTVSDEICDKARKFGLNATFNKNGVIFNEGCTEKLLSELKKNMELIAIVALAILGTQLLGLLFSLFLCCAIRRNDSHYKA